MSAQQPATPRQMYFYGALAAAAGLYFMLVGFGVLATPGGPRNLHAPLWVVQLIGLIFVLAGAAIVIQGMGHANGSGELPADAPQWMRAAQYFIGVVVFACFALIGSWVAIGGESRQFSGGIPFVSSLTNVSLARVMFGLGAAICWIATIAFAVSGARKLRACGKS
jgi:hypothetical protein